MFCASAALLAMVASKQIPEAFTTPAPARSSQGAYYTPGSGPTRSAGSGTKPRRTGEGPYIEKGGVQMVELPSRHATFTPSPEDRGSAMSQSPDVFLPTSPRSASRTTPPPPTRPHSSLLSATLAALLPSPPTHAPGRGGASPPHVPGRHLDDAASGARSPLIGVTVGGAPGAVRPKKLLPGDLWERLCVEVVSGVWCLRYT
jgi:hypothetical protein